MAKRPAKPLVPIGWREWIVLPEMSDTPIKVKVDTGAMTSALHAFRLRTFEVDGATVARFELHPRQRSGAESIEVEAPVVDIRKIRSSNGKVEHRPVIRTTATLGPVTWPIDVTLTSRDSMGFRMLLGRRALRRRFVVDPGRSYLSTSAAAPKEK